RNAKFGAGLGDAEEGVAAVTAGIASRSAADLSLGDLAANIVLRTVGVERDLRAVEHHQKFGLVGVGAGEQPVERGKAGPALEDSVEAGAKRCLPRRRRIAAIGFEVGIEPPY